MKRYHGNRSKLELEHNIRIDWISDKLVIIRPGFIHDFGHGDHHTSLMRTVEVDEDGQYIPWTGENIPNWRIEAHEILDCYFFYPVNQWMWDHLGDCRVRSFLRTILGIFWGLNCCFPVKDVLLYTIWRIRGCPPVQTFERLISGRWLVITH